MKEVFSMWRHTQMVVLVALSAAIYAAVLIPFKGFPIIPGYIELRPANAFPIVFGLLFGPAEAWGAAIGNLIGDFFGEHARSVVTSRSSLTLTAVDCTSSGVAWSST